MALGLTTSLSPETDGLYEDEPKTPKAVERRE